MMEARTAKHVTPTDIVTPSVTIENDLGFELRLLSWSA